MAEEFTPYLVKTLIQNRDEVRLLNKIAFSHINDLPSADEDAFVLPNDIICYLSNFSPMELHTFLEENNVLSHIDRATIYVPYVVTRWLFTGNKRAHDEDLVSLLAIYLPQFHEHTEAGQQEPSFFYFIKRYLDVTSMNINRALSVLHEPLIQYYFMKNYGWDFSPDGPNNLEDIIRANPQTNIISVDHISNASTEQRTASNLLALSKEVDIKNLKVNVHEIGSYYEAIERARLINQWFSKMNEVTRPMSVTLDSKSMNQAGFITVYERIRINYPRISHYWKQFNLEKEYRQYFPSDQAFWDSPMSLVDIYEMLLQSHIQEQQGDSQRAREVAVREELSSDGTLADQRGKGLLHGIIFDPFAVWRRGWERVRGGGDRQIAQQELSGPPLILEEFVTKLWNHPLLTQTTEVHRKKLRVAFEKVIQDNHLDSTKYFAIPVGSAMWIATNESDLDIRIYALTDEDRRQFFNTRYTKEKIEIKDFGIKKGVDYTYTKRQLIPLLFTPDEYIMGNIAFAQSVRSLLVAQMALEADRWNKEIDEYFNNRIKGWVDGKVDAELEQADKRQQRVADVIEQKAREAGVSLQTYKDYFVNWFNDLESPSLSVFSEALQNSNGELKLSKVREVLPQIQNQPTQQPRQSWFQRIVAALSSAEINTKPIADAMKKESDKCDGEGTDLRSNPFFGSLLPVELLKGKVDSEQDENSQQSNQNIHEVNGIYLSDIHNSSLRTIVSSMYQKNRADVKPTASMNASMELTAIGPITSPANNTWAMSRDMPATDRSWVGDNFSGFETNTRVSIQNNDSIFPFTRKAYAADGQVLGVKLGCRLPAWAQKPWKSATAFVEHSLGRIPHAVEWEWVRGKIMNNRNQEIKEATRDEVNIVLQYNDQSGIVHDSLNIPGDAFQAQEDALQQIQQETTVKEAMEAGIIVVDGHPSLYAGGIKELKARYGILPGDTPENKRRKFIHSLREYDIPIAYLVDGKAVYFGSRENVATIMLAAELEVPLSDVIVRGNQYDLGRMTLEQAVEMIAQYPETKGIGAYSYQGLQHSTEFGARSYEQYAEDFERRHPLHTPLIDVLTAAVKRAALRPDKTFTYYDPGAGYSQVGRDMGYAFGKAYGMAAYATKTEGIPNAELDKLAELAKSLGVRLRYIGATSATDYQPMYERNWTFGSPKDPVFAENIAFTYTPKQSPRVLFSHLADVTGIDVAFSEMFEVYLFDRTNVQLLTDVRSYLHPDGLYLANFSGLLDIREGGASLMPETDTALSAYNRNVYALVRDKSTYLIVGAPQNVVDGEVAAYEEAQASISQQKRDEFEQYVQQYGIDTVLHPIPLSITTMGALHSWAFDLLENRLAPQRDAVIQTVWNLHPNLIWELRTSKNPDWELREIVANAIVKHSSIAERDAGYVHGFVLEALWKDSRVHSALYNRYLNAVVRFFDSILETLDDIRELVWDMGRFAWENATELFASTVLGLSDFFVYGVMPQAAQQHTMPPAWMIGVTVIAQTIKIVDVNYDLARAYAVGFGKNIQVNLIRFSRILSEASQILGIRIWSKEDVKEAIENHDCKISHGGVVYASGNNGTCLLRNMAPFKAAYILARSQGFVVMIRELWWKHAVMYEDAPPDKRDTYGVHSLLLYFLGRVLYVGATCVDHLFTPYMQFITEPGSYVVFSQKAKDLTDAALNDAVAHGPNQTDIRKNENFREMSSIIREGIGYYQTDFHGPPVYWHRHPNYYSTMKFIRVMDQKVKSDYVYEHIQINCGQEIVDSYADKSVRTLMLDMALHRSEYPGWYDCVRYGGGGILNVTSGPDVYNALASAQFYTPLRDTDTDHRLSLDEDMASFTIMKQLVESEVEQQGHPVSASFILAHYIGRREGNLGMALIDTTNFLKYQSREALMKLELGQEPEPPLAKSANWMRSHILDEYSTGLSYQDLPENLLVDLTEPIGDAPEYPYPRDGLFAGQEYSALQYKDYTLSNRTGSAYHAWNLAALMYFASPEIVEMGAYANLTGVNALDHGPLKTAADFAVLADLHEIDRVLLTYDQNAATDYGENCRDNNTLKLMKRNISRMLGIDPNENDGSVQ